MRPLKVQFVQERACFQSVCEFALRKDELLVLFEVSGIDQHHLHVIRDLPHKIEEEVEKEATQRDGERKRRCARRLHWQRG